MSSSIQPPARRGSAQPAITSAQRGVDADLEPSRRLPQRPGQPQPVERQDAAVERAPPARRAGALERHREQPAPVGREQRAGREVGADRDQVVVGRPPLRRRERPRRRWRLDGRHGLEPSGRVVNLAVQVATRPGHGFPASTGETSAPLRRIRRMGAMSSISKRLAPRVTELAPGLTTVVRPRGAHPRHRGGGPAPAGRRRGRQAARGAEGRRRAGDPRGHREPRPATPAPRASSPTSAAWSPPPS